MKKVDCLFALSYFVLRIPSIPLLSQSLQRVSQSYVSIDLVGPEELDRIRVGELAVIVAVDDVEDLLCKFVRV